MAKVEVSAYHMVGRLIDAISIRDDFNYVEKATPQGALRVPAIPPATEVAGLLAEGL
jgi:hypothetical protein